MATISSNLCEGEVRNVREKLKNFSPYFTVKWDSSNFYMAYLSHKNMIQLVEVCPKVGYNFSLVIKIK